MRAFALVLLLAAAAVLSLPACGPPCNSNNVCAVEGSAGSSNFVCDGDDYVECDDGHRGQVIFCGRQPRKAVCGAGGWSFEYAALPPQ